MAATTIATTSSDDPRPPTDWRLVDSDSGLGLVDFAPVRNGDHDDPEFRIWVDFGSAVSGHPGAENFLQVID